MSIVDWVFVGTLISIFIGVLAIGITLDIKAKRMNHKNIDLEHQIQMRKTHDLINKKVCIEPKALGIRLALEPINKTNIVISEKSIDWH